MEIVLTIIVCVALVYAIYRVKYWRRISSEMAQRENDLRKQISYQYWLILESDKEITALKHAINKLKYINENQKQKT